MVQMWVTTIAHCYIDIHHLVLGQLKGFSYLTCVDHSDLCHVIKHKIKTKGVCAWWEGITITCREKSLRAINST